jgi:hypothetical protein
MAAALLTSEEHDIAADIVFLFEMCKALSHRAC